VAGTIFSTDNQIWTVVAFRADGTLDPNFGPIGDGTIRGGAGDDFLVESLIATSDGGLALGGTVAGHDMGIIWLDHDGHLAPGFGIAGRADISGSSFSPSAGFAVVEQPLSHGFFLVGDSLAGSEPQALVCHFTSGGMLDETWSVSGPCSQVGITGTHGRAAFATNDDAVLIFGSGIAWNMTASGSVADFAQGPNHEGLSAFAVARQSTGGYLLASAGTVVRLTAMGEGDTSFGFDASGLPAVVAGSAFALASDDSFYLAATGTNASQISVAWILHFNQNGRLDRSFGGLGYAAVPQQGAVWSLNAMGLDLEGRIVVAGSNETGGTGVFRVWP
jgi:hypothetical protein